jgi:hypothetical protein
VDLDRRGFRPRQVFKEGEIQPETGIVFRLVHPAVSTVSISCMIPPSDSHARPEPDTPHALAPATEQDIGAKRAADLITRIALLALALMTINLFMAFYAAVRGASWSLFTFFGRYSDTLADYFKSIAPLPGAEKIHPSDLLGIKDRIIYAKEHWFQAGFSNLHSPPLVMAFFLVNLLAMQRLDPAGCFFALNVALFLYWCALARRYARSRAEAAGWIMLLLFSYPTMLMVFRGNVMAGFTALFIIHAMLLARRGQAPVLAALLLAIAVNLRPNAIVFALPLLLLQHREWLKTTIALGIFGLGIFALSLWLAHELYPLYDLHAFRWGLGLYYQKYVIEDWGLEGGSSLYGGLKLILGGYRPGLELAASLPSLVVVLASALLCLRGRLSPAALIFLTAAAYVLGTAVIADYHLMVFLAVPLMIAGSLGSAPLAGTDRVALIGACLMLVPKHYLYSGEISLQVLFNPLILLMTAVCVVLCALAEPPRRPLEAPA